MAHTRYYVGPVDEIATLLLDGREVVLTRGEAVADLSDADAERLDAQPDNWAPTPQAQPRPTASQLRAASAPSPTPDDDQVLVDHKEGE